MTDADFIRIAKALADPTRRALISRLREAGEMTCSGVCDAFPLSQPTISHHVKTLEGAGLITTRRDGQFHVLTLNESVLEAFAAQLTPDRAGAKSRKYRI